MVRRVKRLSVIVFLDEMVQDGIGLKTILLFREQVLLFGKRHNLSFQSVQPYIYMYSTSEMRLNSTESEKAKTLDFISLLFNKSQTIHMPFSE